MNFLPYKYVKKHPFPVSRVFKKYIVTFGGRAVAVNAFNKKHARFLARHNGDLQLCT